MPEPLQTKRASESAPFPSRSGFHAELERVQDDVLVLGSLVEKAVLRSVDALRTRDLEMARSVVSGDALIDRKRFNIEESVITLLATQQPMAVDLRRLAAVLNIVTDLERMGDYAAGIGRICLDIGTDTLIKPLIDIPRMAEKATSMLHRALETFVSRDVELATAIAYEDDEVDALYEQVYHELLVLMIANPRVIHQATRLLWVAHNLERVADRVQNICERVVFVSTGRMQEFSRGTIA